MRGAPPLMIDHARGRGGRHACMPCTHAAVLMLRLICDVLRAGRRPVVARSITIIEENELNDMIERFTLIGLFTLVNAMSLK